MPPSSPLLRIPLPSARDIRLALHAILSGAFLVAYATGDEDTYIAHLAAGYLVLAALTLRVGAGALLGSGHALRLPQPGPLRTLLTRPWTAGPWIAVLVLVVTAAAVFTGIYADFWPRSVIGHLHASASTIAIDAVLVHMGFSILLYLRGKRLFTHRSPGDHS